MRRIDISERTFGRLTAKSYEGASKWYCICDCGNYAVVHIQKLKSGWTKSCGCLQKEWAKNHQYKHGKTKSSVYRIYKGMIRRCYEKENPAYPNYGGRGITVCDIWRSDFKNFYHDMGDKPNGKSLDRINNNLPYSPENCRWATWYQQQSNKRSNTIYEYNGISATQTNWSRILQIGQSRFRLYAVSHGPNEAIEYYKKLLKLNDADLHLRNKELMKKHEDS